MNQAVRRISAAIRRVGSEVSLIRGDLRISFPAVIQTKPVGDQAEGTPLGRSEQGRYTLYASTGTGGERVLAGDLLIFRGERYYVCGIEAVFFGGEVAYHHGLLRRAPGGDAL